MRITFVCLGNICRSPMAEFIAKDIAVKNSLNILFDSCGTSSYHLGEDMHSSTKKILLSNNIECNNFHSKPITKEIFNSSDYVLVMDDSNYKDIINKFGNHGKIKKIIDFCDYEYYEVPDPWYTGNFNETYKILKNAINNFLKTI